jgi:cob(I)alamin adenosyltransferase
MEMAKSSAAIGRGLVWACLGKKVIIVRFLIREDWNEIQLFIKLEQERIKLFRFLKSRDSGFDHLPEEQQAEEIKYIKNGMNFAKKVLTTKECDVLILDEVIGLVDEGILELKELISLIEAKSQDTILIISGKNLPEELEQYVDKISLIEYKKNKYKIRFDIDNYKCYYVRNNFIKVVEVAFLISIQVDMSGIWEAGRKGKRRKDIFPVEYVLGNMVNNHMTVILFHC